MIGSRGSTSRPSQNLFAIQNFDGPNRANPTSDRFFGVPLFWALHQLITLITAHVALTEGAFGGQRIRPNWYATIEVFLFPKQ